ncbi:MAG: hypothetical protein ACI841_003325 [Planctomycetota bacterium]
MSRTAAEPLSGVWDSRIRELVLGLRVFLHGPSERATSQDTQRFEDKLERIERTGLSALPRAAALIEAMLANPLLRASQIDQVLGLAKRSHTGFDAASEQLLAFVFPDATGIGSRALSNAATEEQAAARKELLKRLSLLHGFGSQTEPASWSMRQLSLARRALRLEGWQVLEVVGMRPRILRGLWKNPRPLWAMWGPLLLAAIALWLVHIWAPSVPPWIALVTSIGISSSGTIALSLWAPIIPGVLWSPSIRQWLQAIYSGDTPDGLAVSAMTAVGIDAEAYLRAGEYTSASGAVRIHKLDKRELEHAIQFLTSSERIGNCIALRNFVAWTLSAFLTDAAVQLADVYCRGSSKKRSQRAQVWMVAAQRAGRPVLVVNSIEWNEPGLAYLPQTMPEIVLALQSIAADAGFQEIVVGISAHGREWLDERFPQSATQPGITKLHESGAGLRYHFDAFRKSWRLDGSKLAPAYVHLPRRSLSARTYSLILFALAKLRGRDRAAQSHLASARVAHNAWSLPITP